MQRWALDLSNLTNLKYIGLHAADLDALQIEAHLHILSTINAPRLRHITFAIDHDDRCTEVRELDDLVSQKFRTLEVFVVECIGLFGAELERVREEIQTMFSQMNRRGLLTIQSYKTPYNYWCVS